jgi:tRNA-specific 2-thiouridylase
MKGVRPQNPRGQTPNQIPNQYQLLRGVDEKKDQSYFLYLLKQEQLAHTLFPMGGMTKVEVREEAKKRDLPVAEKPDSQGICFVGEVNVREFLKRRIKERVGEVVVRLDRSMDGRVATLRKLKRTEGSEDYIVIGDHNGVWFYTIGQREGFTVKITKAMGERLGFDPTNLPPLYVVGKDVVRNRLIVGTGDQAERKEFEVGEIHWIDTNSKFKRQNLKLLVRIRHGGQLLRAEFKIQNSKFKIKLEKPAFGLAPGQSAVFYSGEECLGGGIIE